MNSTVSISRQIYPDPALPEELIPKESYRLEEEILSGISESSDELPFEILWIDEFDDYDFAESVASGDEGVLILMGNLDPLKIEFLQVYITIYTADQSSWNLDIRLDRSTGNWGVINTEIYGPQSMDGDSDEKQVDQTLSSKETGEIYAAVILQAYLGDFRLPSSDIQDLYIVQNTVLAAEAGEILPPVRTNIEAQLENLPVNITWVENREEVPMDSTTGAIEGGGLIEFGSIKSREDGTVELIVNLHYDEAAKYLATYILKKSAEGNWEILELGGMG